MTNDTTTAPFDVEIFDPPLCCPTGLCGPTLDETLIDLADAVAALTAEGRSVSRHQMASDPQAFMRNRAVYDLIKTRQLEALPITVVRGEVLRTGSYASIDELRAALATTA